MADPSVLRLHESLRQAKDRWAIFLGAGACYDYGIPTMTEIADILRKMIERKQPDQGVSETTLAFLADFCPEIVEGANWNIEDLLTRLHQLLDVASPSRAGFAPVTAVIGKSALDSNVVSRASEELVSFMANVCDLSGWTLAEHGSGGVNYLSDFILAMASFGSPMNRLVRIFTTNIDLCVEAAMARLSQRPRFSRRPDLVLVDGFENAILPTFNMRCYAHREAAFRDRSAVYYWKLHGSIDWTYAHPLTGETFSEEPCFSDQSIIVRRIDTELWGKLANCGAISGIANDVSQPIVIFPTPAKYSQTYTFPYMELFEAFRRTLEDVELLVCVGTSFPDQHIRSAIRAFAERDNTLLFVIDPHLTTDRLKTYIGQTKSIQPAINMGFKDFVNEFVALEGVKGLALETED